MVDHELLDLLICPACGDGAAVTLDPDAAALVCSRCTRRYPIREGIPVMLVDEATFPAAASRGQVLEASARRLP